jgi:hypothetical protein
MKEGYSSMNHKRLAAALLTALALTTLPAMGTAFAEDGVDAYGRKNSAGKSARHRLHHSIRYTGTFGKYG